MADHGCDVHNYHRPTPLLIERHHVWPLGMGGPNTDANKVNVCAGGHYNIHELLADLIRHGELRRGGSAEERVLAQRGYDEWVAAGRPGRPVYAAAEV